MKLYRTMAKYRSKSNPAKVYTVKVDEAGNLSCDCPAWLYQKGNGNHRECKHTQATDPRFRRLTDIPTFAETQAMDHDQTGEARRRWVEGHILVEDL